MRPVRLGAVDYLNARPLVYGLELRHGFALQFDPPSKCAALLHEGSIDVGMIPSIEYLRGVPYHAVPDMAIVSEGPVASVALFTTKPLHEIRTVAADTSSRTSNGLLRVLCYESFGIDPAFIPMPPRPAEMLRRCDAALVIGDAALFFNHASAGAEKIDLGEQWTKMSGPGALNPAQIQLLAQARDAGVSASDAIAAAYCGPEWAEEGKRYLRDNISYDWGPRELEGLRAFYELALKNGIVERGESPTFYSR
jgi:chorismate dehydratase